MRTTVVIGRIGIVLAVAGVLAALGGIIWQQVAPTPDANIGAGLLLVGGVPLAGLGVLLLLVSILLRRSSGPADSPAAPAPVLEARRQGRATCQPRPGARRRSVPSRKGA